MSRERNVELPSHRVVTLRWVKEPTTAPKHSIAAARAALDEGAFEVLEKGEVIDWKTLKLGEFHAIRAIVTKLGWLLEEMVQVDCRHCGVKLTVAPCDTMELEPFEASALDDDELDEPFEMEEEHPIRPIVMSNGGVAKTVVLREVTVEEAAPLLEAVAMGSLVTTPAIVRAMGIVKLGEETTGAVEIAKALDEATEESWQSVTSLFLQANYSLRLFGMFACDSCNARNDVDAPYDREFFVAPDFMKIAPPEADKPKTFPSLAGFAAAAAAAAERIVPERVSERIVVAVQTDVAESAEAGSKTRSSYAPASEGTADAAAEPAKITVFYGPFAEEKAKNEGFDWKAELDDTIEHELAQHLAVERQHEESGREGSRNSD